MYETTARGVVASALEGYNATILAYGQVRHLHTGTGPITVYYTHIYLCRLLCRSLFRVAGSVDSRARADVDVCGCGVADGHGQDLHHGGIQ